MRRGSARGWIFLGLVLASALGLLGCQPRLIWKHEVVEGEVVDQSWLGEPRMRLSTGELVEAYPVPCALEPGERHPLSQRIRAGGDIDYEVVCLDRACRHVEPCGFDPPERRIPVDSRL